jgi:hypothetical protein
MKREEFETKTKTRKEKKKKKQILMTRKRYDDIIVRNQCTVEDEVVGRDDDVVADEEEEEEEEVFDVYIEDTDHYGVVYYANYFKFCAQAFEGYLVNRSSMIKRDEVLNGGEIGISDIGEDEGIESVRGERRVDLGCRTSCFEANKK